jgi:cathepsin D
MLISAIIMTPPNDATILHQEIPGSKTDGEGNFFLPCNTDTEVSVILGGISFQISPKDYVGSQLSTNLCQSNIVGQLVGNPTQWLLGDVFLKNVYTVFDYDHNQVQFGAVASTLVKRASLDNM